MDATQAAALRELLASQPVAALATLHKGHPAVSMVPLAWLPGSARALIHVSALATHTADMQADPRVALLLTAPPSPDVPVHALPRVSLQGLARPCPREAEGYADARAAYLARFPDVEPLFGFGDFSLFLIEVRSARYVGGFAQAMSVTGERFARLLDEAAEQEKAGAGQGGRPLLSR